MWQCMIVFRGSPGGPTPFWNSGRNDGTAYTNVGTIFQSMAFVSFIYLSVPKFDSVLSPYLAANQKSNSAAEEANVAAKLCFCDDYAIATFLKHQGIVSVRGRFHQGSRPKYHQPVRKDMQTDDF